MHSDCARHSNADSELFAPLPRVTNCAPEAASEAPAAASPPQRPLVLPRAGRVPTLVPARIVPREQPPARVHPSFRRPWPGPTPVPATRTYRIFPGQLYYVKSLYGYICTALANDPFFETLPEATHIPPSDSPPELLAAASSVGAIAHVPLFDSEANALKLSPETIEAHALPLYVLAAEVNGVKTYFLFSYFSHERSRF